jgi:hypothetical protein
MIRFAAEFCITVSWGGSWMPRNSTRGRVCPNAECRFHAQPDAGNIVLHSFFRLKHGHRRRYRCTACGRTFCSTTGTPYHRIHHRKNLFDAVAAMSVEGVSKASIARIKGKRPTLPGRLILPGNRDQRDPSAAG